jgi:methylenetetrahydrofolate--tRNA-(uracil-5-)-methyltransferase
MTSRLRSERWRLARCSTNVNFGLLPPVTGSKPETPEGRWRGPEKDMAKKKTMSVRALADIQAWA